MLGALRAAEKDGKGRGLAVLCGLGGLERTGREIFRNGLTQHAQALRAAGNSGGGQHTGRKATRCVRLFSPAELELGDPRSTLVPG